MRKKYNLEDASTRNSVQVRNELLLRGSGTNTEIEEKVKWSKSTVDFTKITLMMQVYPSSWSAILVSMDNKGMWNLRSGNWVRRYLGQEVYMRVWNNERSLYTEYDIPDNALLCGKAKN